MELQGCIAERQTERRAASAHHPNPTHGMRCLFDAISVAVSEVDAVDVDELVVLSLLLGHRSGRENVHQQLIIKQSGGVGFGVNLIAVEAKIAHKVK